MAGELKFLEIARMLNQKQPIPVILKNLGVSGHDVAKVKEMIENGVIVFNPDGEPRFTIPLTKIKAITTGRLRKRTLTPEELSRLTVVEAHQEALAEEARNQTDAYLILGRAIWQAFNAWAVKHGYTLEDIRNMPIHKIIIEAIILKEALRLLGREDCKDVIEVFQQHKLIINFVHQYINLLDSPQSGVNIIKELRKLIDLHYEKEEAEIFPRILKLYLREKSG
jgi:hypothetical protein